MISYRHKDSVIVLSYIPPSLSLVIYAMQPLLQPCPKFEPQVTMLPDNSEASLILAAPIPSTKVPNVDLFGVSYHTEYMYHPSSMYIRN